MVRPFKVVAALAALSLVVYAHAQPVPFWSNKIVHPGDFAEQTFPTVVSPLGDSFAANGSAYANALNITRIDRNGVITTNKAVINTAVVVSPNFIAVTADGGAVVSMDWANSYDGFNFIPSGSRLIKFDSSLNVQWNIVINTAYSDTEDNTRPGRLYATPDGSIFCAQYVNGVDTIFKYSATGTLLWSQSIDPTGLVEMDITDMITDGSGGVWTTLFTASGQGGSIVHGGLAHLTGSASAATPHIYTNTYYAYHIAKDSNGNLFFDSRDLVSGTDIAKTDPNGNFMWLGRAASYANDPYGVAVDPMGYSYLLSQDSSKAMVSRFDPSGNVVYSNEYGLNNAPQHYSLSFTIDPGGDAFLYSSNGYGLTKILPNGALGWPNLTNGTYVAPNDASYQPDAIRGARDVFGNFYLAASFSDPNNKSTFYNGAAKLGQGNNSAFFSQTVPGTMIAGQHYQVAVSFHNVGLNNWTAASNYNLKSQNPGGNSIWGMNHVNLNAPDNVANGDTYTFHFTVTAPMAGGSTNFQWKVAQGTGAFGMASTNKVVTVNVRQNAAGFVTQTIPTSMKAGSTFTVHVTMENVGTTSWTQAAGFALQPAPGAPTWGVTSALLGSTDTIARGANKVFSFTATAPGTPGTYPMSFQMHRTATAFTGFFGDITPTVQITVTP